MLRRRGAPSLCSSAANRPNSHRARQGAKLQLLACSTVVQSRKVRCRILVVPARVALRARSWVGVPMHTWRSIWRSLYRGYIVKFPRSQFQKYTGRLSLFTLGEVVLRLHSIAAALGCAAPARQQRWPHLQPTSPDLPTSSPHPHFRTPTSASPAHLPRISRTSPRARVAPPTTTEAAS